MEFVSEGFLVDRSAGRVLHNGRDLRLDRRAFDVLSYLMQHHDRVVAKEELLAQVWGVKALSEGVLSNTIAKLRRALGQSRDDRYPIETVYGAGYRFRAASPEKARAPASSGVEVREHVPQRDIFVGRESLMRLLRERLLPTQPGSENVILLAGEAGIGKTRVARELSRAARKLNMHAWTGAAHEGEGAPPYWPWIQVMRAAHDELGEAAFRACLPTQTWALAPLAPELCGSSSPPAALEPQAARFSLFEALSSFLKKAASTRALLVVLDDIQFADAGSLELLQFAARALQEQPLTFLATMRIGESPEPWQANASLARLSRISTVLELAGLSADAVGDLIVALMGGSNAELALALHRRTRGNPLFVCQSLDLMRQQGVWSLEHEISTGLETPPGVRTVIRSRLRGLPVASRPVLTAAAVVGQDFDASLLAAVMEQEVAQTLDLLEPALRMRIIEEHPLTAGAFSFAHTLVRESLYEELPMSGRGGLHGRIAAELMRRHGHESSHLAAIAHQMLHAVPCDVVAAMTACRRAAAAARETSSFEISAQILSAGLSKLEHSSGSQDCEFSMLLELGEDLFHAGRGTRAWLAFRSAAESALDRGNPEQLAQIAPRLTDCTDIGLGDYGFVRSVVERALALNTALPDAVNACLLAQCAQLSVELPSEERHLLLERAAQLASGSGDLGAVLEVAHTAAIIRDPTRLAENERAAEHFLALVERHPEPAAAMRYRTVRGFNAHFTLYLCALTVGDLSAADLILARCHQLAETSHVRSAQFVVSLARAGRALGEARLVELSEVVSRGIARCDSGLSLEREAWRVYESSRVEGQGQLHAEGIEPELDQLRRLTSSRFLAQVAVLRARRLASTGNSLRARVVMALVPSAVLQRMPVRYGDLGILCSLAEVRLALNELEAAEHLYEKLSPYAAFNAVGPAFDYRGSVAHFLGLIAHALGRVPAAVEHFREAVAMNRRLNMPAQLGRSERHLQDVTKELERT